MSEYYVWMLLHRSLRTTIQRLWIYVRLTFVSVCASYLLICIYPCCTLYNSHTHTHTLTLAQIWFIISFLVFSTITHDQFDLIFFKNSFEQFNPIDLYTHKIYFYPNVCSLSSLAPISCFKLKQNTITTTNLTFFFGCFASNSIYFLRSVFRLSPLGFSSPCRISGMINRSRSREAESEIKFNRKNYFILFFCRCENQNERHNTTTLDWMNMQWSWKNMVGTSRVDANFSIARALLCTCAATICVCICVWEQTWN